MIDVAQNWNSFGLPVHDMEAALYAIIARELHPGESVQAPEWVERHISLPTLESRFSGRYSFARTPYARGALRLMAHSRYRHVQLIWGAQTSKTLLVLLFVAYLIDQRPTRVLYAGPDKKFIKIKSRSHLQPLIEENEILKRHTTGRRDDIQNFEMRLKRMMLSFGWAGSPSTLAGESVPELIIDESGKFKQRDKDEGDPRFLALRRLIAYGELGHCVEVTTPSTAGHASWTDFLVSSQHRRWLPCPHCGKPDEVADIPDPVIDCDVPSTHARLNAAGYQILEFKQFKGFSGLRKPEDIKRATYYECRHCKGRIEHKQVRDMDELGKWIPTVSGCDIAALHLPSWYRDITTMSFGNVAARFIAARGNPEKLKEWKTHDAAEAWEETGEGKTVKEILAHCRDYPARTVPFVPLAIFLTADLRDTEIHFVIRAWGEYETSALLAYGVLPRMVKDLPAGTEPTGESLSPLDPYLAMTFKASDGNSYPVTLAAVDSGWKPDEVYAFCRKRPYCVAMKAEYNITDTIKFSRPERIPGTTKERPDSCYLFAWNHRYYADVWAAKLNYEKDAPGEVMLHAGTGEDYGAHLAAEAKKLIKNKWGREVSMWVRVEGTPPNHWLDCERQQVVCARYMNIGDRHLPENTPTNQATTTPPATSLHRDFSDFTGRLQQ